MMQVPCEHKACIPALCTTGTSAITAISSIHSMLEIYADWIFWPISINYFWCCLAHLLYVLLSEIIYYLPSPLASLFTLIKVAFIFLSFSLCAVYIYIFYLFEHYEHTANFVTFIISESMSLDCFFSWLLHAFLYTWFCEFIKIKLYWHAVTLICLYIYLLYLFFYLFFLFMATSVAYGSSWVRGRIRTAAAGLHHSHSNARSEPQLWPMPQLVATLDIYPTEQGQGSNPHPHKH